MTKTDELMFMADRYAGIGLGFGDPGPQRDALRTAIEQALAEAREEGIKIGVLQGAAYAMNPPPPPVTVTIKGDTAS